MYWKYKDASKVVDKIKRDQQLPTDKQIARIVDWQQAPLRA